MCAPGPTGRFAPSPTGPLHLGSLVAAVGSWLFARSAGGRWLVRMEDLDEPRVEPGAAEEILRALERYGLFWDGPVETQSRRQELYREALEQLRGAGRAFDCACSRAELTRAASAPSERDPVEAGGPVYPGTCRRGVPEGRSPRAVRFRVGMGTFSFRDAVFGAQEEETENVVGDFVVKRADGPFAYQLAVVVDDHAQGVTQVVRGADLLSSTARQIALQRALGYETPAYAHLPLVLGPDGTKLGKRDGSLPLERLDERYVRLTLAMALGFLGQRVSEGGPGEMLAEALHRFEPGAIPRGPVSMASPASPSSADSSRLGAFRP